MGKNPEQEIQQKLVELELAMKEEELKQTPSVIARSKELAKGKQKSALSEYVEDASLTVEQSYEERAMKADLYTFGGLALIGVSVLWLCLHIQVYAGMGAGALAGLLGQRMYIGLFLIPIFVGITMLFYNFRSRMAQLITAGSIGLLLFTVLMQLQMNFARISLLELVLMILPVCAGISLLYKGHYKRQSLKALTKENSD